jgi:hypothetical protein
MGKSRLKYFNQTQPSLGIAKSFADTIVLLKSNGVDVERLGLILDTRGGGPRNPICSKSLSCTNRKKQDLASWMRVTFSWRRFERHRRTYFPK